MNTFASFVFAFNPANGPETSEMHTVGTVHNIVLEPNENRK